jgi:lysine/ornithine N-monooxygenase
LPWGSELEHGAFQKSLSRSFLPVLLALKYTGLIPCCLQEIFEGEVIHSLQYTTAKKYAGKKVVVVGTATSGHDVASDLASHGVGQ